MNEIAHRIAREEGLCLQEGDFVTRKSYGGDIVFVIRELHDGIAILEGTVYRLIADAPIEDLEAVEANAEEESEAAIQGQLETTVRWITQKRKAMQQDYFRDIDEKTELGPSYFEMPGKVLHLDGDERYLEKCLQLYDQLRIPADGYFVREAEMAELLQQVLPQSRPDIIVVTGHDALIKQRQDQPYHLSSYKNSHHFVNAVQVARQFEHSRDSLTIIAGACQSHFEALLKAGANFASSPGRVMIHALDPVQVASKVAYTSVRDTIHTQDALGQTVSGIKGMGGVETRGSYRLGLPNVFYE